MNVPCSDVDGLVMHIGLWFPTADPRARAMSRHSAYPAQNEELKAIDNPRHKRPESPPPEERDFVERKAEHLISIGTDALEAKARERLGAAPDELEAPLGGGGLDAPAVASKVLKEAAAELQRREGHAHGHTEAATDAAFAQRVASGHYAPGSAEERVAARVRERFAGAGPALAGVNPDAGRDSAHGKGEWCWEPTRGLIWARPLSP
jgi:hypothetical protein